VNSSIIGRDRDIDLPADETIVDVIAPFKDNKEPVEMTIGDGMEFTIPGTFTSFKTILGIFLNLSPQ